VRQVAPVAEGGRVDGGDLDAGSGRDAHELRSFRARPFIYPRGYIAL
jgi:hypothetical protein